MAHHLTTGRFTKFHGHNRDGSFQTGKGEHVRLWTIHEIRHTGVISTRQELVDAGYLGLGPTPVTLSAANPITIQGTEYITNLAYDDALFSQTNLDAFIQRFDELGTIVDVVVTAAVNTATNPNVDFTNPFLGGADTFGSQITDDGDIWQLDVRFEQKGMFTNVPGSAGFVRGEPSIALAADNFGSSVADIHELLEDLALTTTTDDATNVDNTTETNTEGRPDAGPQVSGSLTTGVSAAQADEATGQSIVLEVNVGLDLQS